MTAVRVKNDGEFPRINTTLFSNVLHDLQIKTHAHNPTTMKPTFFLLTALSALVAAAPVHTSATLHPLPIHHPVSGAGSGQMVDNMLPNNDPPGGGIASSSPTVSKRALANAAPDTFDSSTYYDVAAEREAEELALVLDAASANVAGDESAGDNDVKAERRRKDGSGNGNRRRRVAGACREYTPAKCDNC
jgi:hypothetical protein